ncbi:MAG: hypothetical protein J6M17_10490 [Ruminococcus sp.]|nr:hypothetical protein [Ruminococcus sp.]
MSNLMRAEWFRIRRSKNIFIILLSTELVVLLFQFIGDDGFRINAAEYFSYHANMGVMMAVFTATLIVSEPFNSKLADYEIMKGTPPMHTIISKTLMSLIIETVTYYLPTMILLKIFDGENITLKMMLLLYLCIIKLTVVSMSLAVIFKGMLGNMLFFFVFSFANIPLVLISGVTGADLTQLTSYMTSTQLVMIGGTDILDMSKVFEEQDMLMSLDSAHIGSKVIISLAVVTAVMTALAYRALKCKKQIDTV